MAYNDLLDDYDKKEQLLWKALEWWESRRLRFNMIVGGIGLLVLIIGYFPRMGMVGTIGPFAFMVITYGITCNIAYLAGWVLELLLQYYFKVQMSEIVRNVLFSLGTFVALFPILLALVVLMVG